ncbi:MAG: hypothetical protein ACYTXY_36600 [Nostoc sp.]
MQSKPLNKTTDIIQPLNDTWGFKGADDNFWGITSSFDFTSISTQEVNAWFATVVTETLDAFSDLTRVWEVNFGSIYREDVEPVCLE